MTPEEKASKVMQLAMFRYIVESGKMPTSIGTTELSRHERKHKIKQIKVLEAELGSAGWPS